MLPDVANKFQKVLNLPKFVELDDTENLFVELETLVTNRIVRNKRYILAQIVSKGTCIQRLRILELFFFNFLLLNSIAGILLSGIDWQKEDPVTDVSLYLYDVLLHLTFVHAELTETVKPVKLRPILASVATSAFVTVLDSLHYIPSFTIQGMKQVEAH
jgi:hypothetical protein